MAFFECNSLTSVYYDCTNPIEGASDIFEVWPYEKATLYVPSVAVEKCKIINPWKNFKSIKEYGFSGIEDITADIDSNAPYEVYTINGTMIGHTTEGLDSGIYIIRQGNRAKKIVIK